VFHFFPSAPLAGAFGGFPAATIDKMDGVDNDSVRGRILLLDSYIPLEIDPRCHQEKGENLMRQNEVYKPLIT